MATVTHKVVKGDTLSAIAKKYGTTVDAIAKLNNIKNVNLIYVGQVLTISGKSSTDVVSKTPTNTTPSTPSTPDYQKNQCSITSFGLQAGTERTLFAIWQWSKANTDHCEVEWDYQTKDGNWFTGSRNNISYAGQSMHGGYFDSTYSVPENATRIRFRVRPISATYTENNVTKKYWDSVWTGYQYYDANLINNPPTKKPEQEPASSNQCKVTAFGLQAGSERTLFAIWTWQKANTDHCEVQWEYQTKDGNWFIGAHSNVDYGSQVMHGYQFESTYNVPEVAVMVRFRVRPISKTYTDKNNTVSYWLSVWTGYHKYDTVVMNTPEPEPIQIPTLSQPNVVVNNYKLECKIENIDTNVKNTSIKPEQYLVEFEVVKDDATRAYTGLASIFYSTATYTFSIDPGYNYKVRCRLKVGDDYGEWSNFSSTVQSVPSQPSSAPNCYATSSTSIRVTWPSVNSADYYELEYSDNIDHFDNLIATLIKVEGNNRYEVTGLDSGAFYYFRVRACNESGNSAWTGVSKILIGTTPIAPSTWSSTTTAVVGEDIILYWIHSNEDGSAERRAEVEVYYDDVRLVHNVINEEVDDDNPQKTSQFVISTNGMTEGKVLKWRVRTAGITEELGEWSVQRVIDVYAKPSLSVLLLDAIGQYTRVITSFPLNIKAKAGPATQSPVNYHVNIIPRESYETVDEFGNFKMVMAGDPVFARSYDISTDLDITLTPQDLDLQSDIPYDLVCTVGMDSGLTAEEIIPFSVFWTDVVFTPNAQIVYDPDKIVTHINPYCEYYPYIFYEVTYENEQWIRTDKTIDYIEGISVDNALTRTHQDVVYAGYLDDVLTHFCIVLSEEAVLVPDITLSVYRREFDGTFTEIGTGLANSSHTFVADPHPPLDYARYRIVATSDLTGAMSFVDLPPYPIQVKTIVLQWNEDWTDYKLGDEGAVAKQAWQGSMLQLPYNIDVTESNETDVSLIAYIGRKQPVSYYGTQLGTTAIWNCDVPKYDSETIYALRRLAVWMGDVYVREPSGTGYWARVSVSFSHKHCELVVPVTIDITRVSGGK
jgi:hypothetical protein